MTNPCIITCAITGAELSKQKCPALPITPDEQAIAAEQAVDAGASIIHLHVRDELGEPSQSLDQFEEAILKIRARVPEAIIQMSTGGAVGEVMEKRMAPLALKPEMASLNMGSMNFGNEIFSNLPSDILQFHDRMQSLHIRPEMEVYDIGMLEYAAKLYKTDVLKKPVHIQFVLGVPGGMSGDLRNFVHALTLMESHFGPEVHWSVAGVGRYQLNLATYALLLGGNVRVGLEDNIYYKKGVLAESNAQLVSRVARLAEEFDREVATPLQARALLGLPKKAVG